MRLRAQRIGLVAGMVLAGLNVWTGAPLLGLLIASRVTGGERITMLAVFVAAATMLAGCWAMIGVLAELSARHDALTGRRATVRRHTPWLRPMSGERPHDVAGGVARITAVEYVVIAMLVLAALLFEYWFFFESGSPFDQRSGR